MAHNPAIEVLYGALGNRINEMAAELEAQDRRNLELELKLNEDILAALFRYLPSKRTVLCLMNTCHFLYSAGIPYLLDYPVTLRPYLYRAPRITARRRVDIYTRHGITPSTSSMLADAHSERNILERKIISFTDFILVDAQRRASYLKDIELSKYFERVSDDTLGKVAEVLRHASNLHTFSSTFSPLSAISIAPILEALSEHQNIRNLKLCLGQGSEAVDMLQRWRAPLERVRLVLGGGHPRQDPTWIMRTFSGTLEEMAVSNCREFYPAPGPIFPRVTKLELTKFHWRLRRVWNVAHAYPNLTHLIVGIEERMMLMLDQDPEACRRENWQGNLGHCWGSLEIVEGDVEAVYTLGLPCKIHHLQLSMLNSHSSHHPRAQEMHTMLRTILEVARPSHVSLQVELDWNGSSILQAFQNTTREDRLSLDVALNVQSPTWTGGQIIDPLISDFLRLGHLHYLQLSVTNDKLRWYMNVLRLNEAAPVAPPRDPAEVITKGSAAAVALAVRIVRRIPTLNTFELKLPHNVTHEWAVDMVGEQGGRQLRCASSQDVFEVPF